MSASAQSEMNGAWQSGGDKRKVMIVAGSFFSVVISDATNNAYASTFGGSLQRRKSQWIIKYEFNTQQPELVGTSQTWQVEGKGKTLNIKAGATNEAYTLLDDGKPGLLAGAWLITGRETESGFQQMTPGARRTMKILSGTRFQWIAYNVDTKEFFGTGAGSYTSVDGKYTENIDVFSRDNSRVGSTLQFDFKLENGKWRHQGKSSKGEPLNEVWTKREQLGL